MNGIICAVKSEGGLLSPETAHEFRSRRREAETLIGSPFTPLTAPPTIRGLHPLAISPIEFSPTQPVRIAPRADSLDDWAHSIKRGFVDRLASALEFGRTVYAVKLALDYGGWEEMFRRRSEFNLPFGKTVGKSWAQVGEVCGEVGRDPDHLEVLPGSFGALYQLSRLGIELLRAAIRDGAMRSDLTEAEAREVVYRYKPDLRPEPRPFDRDAWLEDLQNHMAQMENEGTLEDLEAVLPVVEQCFDEFCAKASQRPKPQPENFQP